MKELVISKEEGAKQPILGWKCDFGKDIVKATIPSSITTIREEAFLGCRGLAEG
jgi:hypothetical protein